jgi:iron complex outermembrane receptor protein
MSVNRSAALLAGLFIVPNAWAEERDEAAVVVTATRFQQPRQHLPFGAIVITARQIQEGAVSSVQEALSKLGGVDIRNNSGSPNPQLDLRGFGAAGDQNTLVLLDGQRISENEQTTAQLSAIPLDAIERIEILPGSGAVLYGSGATGGTINIITKKPRARQREATLGLMLGSYDTRRLDAGITLAGERLGLSLNANDTDTDNYRVNNHLSEQNVEGDLRFLLDRGELYTKFGAARQRLGLPGSLSEAQIAQDRRQASTPDDHSAADSGHLNIGGRTELGFGELAADLGYRTKESDAQFVSFASVTRTEAEIWSFTPRIKLPYRVAGVDSQLVIGADWFDWQYRRRIDADFFTSDVTADQRDTALYFQNVTQLGPETRLSAGARSQRTRIEQAENAFPQPPQDQTIPLNAFDLGLRQGLGGDFSLFAKWGQSFRVANVDDNGFTADGSLLQPQKSHDAQAGVEWSAASARARLTVFESRVNNEIHFIAIPGTNFFNGFNTNLPPTRHRGVEVDGGWQILPALNLSASYRYTDARFREGVFFGVDITGNEVPLVPRNRASLNAAWQITGDLVLTGSARYVGPQRYDNDQTNTFPLMPSYLPVDLKLVQRLGDWRLSAQVDNLFDDKYYTYAIRNNAGTSFNAYPEAERRFFVAAQYAFR